MSIENLNSLEEHMPPLTITIPYEADIRLDCYEDKKSVILPSNNSELSELEKMFSSSDTYFFGWKNK